MSTIRVIRKLPRAISILPGLNVAWGTEDQYIDEVFEGDESNIPPDAIYAAMCDDNGVFTDIICAPLDLKFVHHFAGWDLNTFPRQTLP